MNETSEIEDLKLRISRLEESVNRYIRQMYDEASGFGCKPEDALIKSRKIAEAISKQLVRLRGEEGLPDAITLNTLIAKLQERDKANKLPVPRQVITSLNGIRDRANQWCHDTGLGEVPRQVLRSALSDLSYLVEWYFYDLLGEKRSWWSQSYSSVLRHARSITMLGLTVVISLALVASIFTLAVGVGIYRNFFRGNKEQKEPESAGRDFFQALAPKPAFIKLNSDPTGAWCWVYPKSLAQMVTFKRDDDAGENAMPMFGQTPFGRVSKNLSLMSLFGGQMGTGEKGVVAMIFKPGYELKSISLDATTGDLDFGTVKLKPLNEAKAQLVSMKQLLSSSNHIAGRVIQLQGTIALPQEGSALQRSLRQALNRGDGAASVDELPSAPVFLSFSEPPFADVLGLFVAKDEFELLAQKRPEIRAGNAVKGRLIVYFPVAPFNALYLNQKFMGHLRRIDGLALHR